MKVVPLTDRILQFSIGLLALLPLARFDSLNWWEYVRLWLIVAGLAYLLRQQLWKRAAGQRLAGLLLALGFLFVVLQFGGETLQTFSTWMAIVLSLAGFAALIGGGFGGFPDRLDWVALVVVVVLISGAMSAGLGFSWSPPVRFGALLLLWFAVRRGVERSPETGRWLGMALVGALALVSLVGLIRVSSVPYYRMRGLRARAAGQLDVATRHFGRSLQVAGRLGLDDAADGLTFRLASILHARGQDDKAAALLGLESDLSAVVVPADSWDGPEGGRLFNIRSSCWKDIRFYPGEIELRIYASGDQALGVWPLMQVRLDGQVLDEVFVSSDEVRPYSFEITMPRYTRQRLQLIFMNDYFNLEQRIDRNLWVEHAEVHYQRIFWE